AAPSAVTAPNAVAPASPFKNIGTAEPVWIAPSLNNEPVVSSLSGVLVQEEFTFPEFNDDDFSSSPLKSAPITAIAAEKSVNSVIRTDQFKVSAEPSAQQGIFSLDAGSPAFAWNSDPNQNLLKVKNVSSNVGRLL
ncbi:hypothetical protein BVRB_026860, partial [Beta vulgaris subsp. vulgaris]